MEWFVQDSQHALCWLAELWRPYKYLKCNKLLKSYNGSFHVNRSVNIVHKELQQHVGSTVINISFMKRVRKLFAIDILYILYGYIASRECVEKISHPECQAASHLFLEQESSLSWSHEPTWAPWSKAVNALHTLSSRIAIIFSHLCLYLHVSSWVNIRFLQFVSSLFT
jgi:hypothetical protein